VTNKPITASSGDDSRGLFEVIKTAKGINVLRETAFFFTGILGPKRS
jgi:hypothetical protein